MFFLCRFFDMNAIINLKRNFQSESSSDIFFTFKFNIAAHCFNKAFRNRHTKTGTAERTSCTVKFLCERLKNMFLKFLTHSDTCILTNKFNQRHITDTTHLSAIKYNLAIVPVILNGIAQYVHKHTLYMYRTSDQVPMFNLIIALNNFKLMFFRLFLDHINNVTKQLF